MKTPLTEAEVQARLERLAALTADQAQMLLVRLDGYAPDAVDACLEDMATFEKRLGLTA